MGCWVVPAIAAELWNVSLSFVLEAAKEGRLRTKSEAGFLLVDTDPNCMKLLPPKLPKDQRPPTFTAIVTKEELAALTADEPAEEMLDDSAEEVGQLDWRITRQQVARTRRRAVA